MRLECEAQVLSRITALPLSGKSSVGEGVRIGRPGAQLQKSPTNPTDHARYPASSEADLVRGSPQLSNMRHVVGTASTHRCAYFRAPAERAKSGSPGSGLGA